MPHRLICYGDLCVDVVVRVSAVPQAGQDATVDQLEMTAAGAAANCAVAAARSGADVELLGTVGEDAFGGLMLQRLSAAGVGVSHVSRAAGRSGMVISIVQTGGERTLYSHRGVNAAPYTIPSNLFKAGDCLYLSGYSFQTEACRATAGTLASFARSVGARCALDPSFQFARDVRLSCPESLAGLDFIFPNREEAALITGFDSPPESAAVLHSLGVTNVVVKLGGQGCYVDTPDIQTLVPAQPLAAVVDSTGAGDAFCGVFLAAILTGAGVVQAAQQANAAGADMLARCGSNYGQYL
jgi:sugar/nucleoside kinase (ribokinase family)